MATMSKLNLNFSDGAILQLRKSVIANDDDDQQTNQSGFPSRRLASKQISSPEKRNTSEERITETQANPDDSPSQAIQRYKRAQEVLQNQVSSLRQRNEKLYMENKALVESEKSKMIQDSCQIDRLVSELQENRKRISEQRCQIDALRLELDERKSRSVDQTKKLEEKVTELSVALTHCRQGCQMERQTLVATQDDLTHCQNLASDYKRQIVMLTGQVEYQLDQRKNEIIEKEREKFILKKKFETEISALKIQLDIKDKDQLEASVKIEKQKETIRHLSQGLKKIQTEEIPCLIGMFETKKNEVQALNAELENKRTEHEVLTTEMKILQVRLNSAETRHSDQIVQQDEEMQLFRTKSQQEITSLNDEIGKLRHLNEFSDSEMCQLRIAMKKLILEAEKFQTQLNVNEKEIKLLNKKLSFAKTQLNIKVKEIIILKKQSGAKDLELSRHQGFSA